MQLNSLTNDEVWKHYLAANCNASAMAAKLGVPARSARQRIADIKSTEKFVHTSILEQEDTKNENDLAEALQRANIPQEVLEGGKLHRFKVTSWGNAAYDKKLQKWVTKGLRSSTAEWDFSPKEVDWPPIVPPTIQEIVSYKSVGDSSYKNPGWKVMILGDTQIGFWKEDATDPKSKLVPFHDLKAIEIFLQALAIYKPNEIVILGDTVDLPDFSKHQHYPEFSLLTNETLKYAKTLLLRIRSICPKAKIVWIPGNHEKRLLLSIINNLGALHGIKKPGHDNFPLLSIPFLLDFEGLKIETVGEFPGGEYWITPTLVATHEGPNNNKDIRADVIHGHNVEEQHRSHTIYLEGNKTQTFQVWCIPGLARYGANPIPFIGSATLTPSNRKRINAQQAFATVDIHRSLGIHTIQPHRIFNGVCDFRGTPLKG